ncbi:MAG: TolC family protein, partial [Candidatus Electrothrix sp. AUS1_2]|nr:TolC family protein [Candidatus Electrothrix sp. AUS1_2]
QVLAAYQEESNLLNLQNTLMDTITDVVRTYRSFLLVQRGLEINRLSLERAQELLEKNRILIEEGRKAKVELIETEANVASQELNFMISRNAVDAARLELLKLLDIDQHLSIEPTESIEVEPVRLKEKTLLQLALKNRPEYRQALLALKEAQTNLFLAENEQQWQLDFAARYNITDSGEYTVDSSEETSDGAGDYSVSMELTIPFGDDSTERNLLSAKVACRKAEIALKELKENIEISVQNTRRDIDMQWKQVELSQKARDLSRKQLDVELEKFKNGNSENFQVVSYQNSLIASELNENRTKIDYLNALTELDRFLGTTLEHWGIDPATVRKVELP